MPVPVSYPGVYIEEISSGVRTIVGVSTSITAFVGAASRGPVNRAVRIFNFGDYERNFGGLDAISEMSYSVRQFFLNGGSDAYVIRLAKNAAPASILLKDGTGAGAKDALKLTALSDGKIGESISVVVEQQTGTDNPFNLTLVYTPTGNPGDNAIETYTNVSMSATSPRYVLDQINGVSQLVKAEIPDTTANRPFERPDHGTLTSGTISPTPTTDATHKTFTLTLDSGVPSEVTLATGLTSLNDIATAIQTVVRALKPNNPAYTGFTATVSTNKLVLSSGTRGAGSSVAVAAGASNDLAESLKLLTGAVANPGASVFLTGGTEDPFTEADYDSLYIASRSDRKGIYALESVDLFNLLVLPGVTTKNVLDNALAYCTEKRAFLIADSPRGVTKPGAMEATISGTAYLKSEYGAVYYPWVRIPDPLKGGKLRLAPPSGTVAGVYARTDASRGVWKAPAGTEATMVGVQALEYVLTDPENGILNPVGVNCLRNFPVIGSVVWGSRTLRGADILPSDYKYVPVRRLALFIEESLYRGTQWVVFEPNDEPLWSQIRLNLGAFMNNLFRQGAFQGRTPREAYFVKCDKETTTQNDINLGKVNIVVGFAPLKPAEFVVIQIQQIAGQIVS